MNHIDMPEDLSTKEKLILQEQLVEKHWNGAFFDTSFAIEAARINDNPGITNTKREELLINLFAEHNIELTFVD